jgi:hypothetical protein
MDCLRKPNEPMPTEGQRPGGPSSVHCSAEACNQTSRLAFAPSLDPAPGRIANAFPS